MSRRRNYKLLFVLLLFIAPAYDAGSESPIYKITISLPQRLFKLGEPILAHVSLKNVSNEKIVVGLANGPQQAQVSYKITVTDESGHQITLKSSIRHPGQIPKPSFSGSRASEGLAPNETLEEDSVITELFVLDRPGKYTLEFARWIPGSDKKFVYSNTLTFSIVR